MNPNDLNRTAWALWRAGDARRAVANWMHLAGQQRRAARMDEALAVVRTLVHLTDGVDLRLQRVACHAMSETQRELGNLGEAARFICRALQGSKARGDRGDIADDLLTLGDLAEERGKLSAASRWRRRALALLDGEECAATRHDVLIDLARTCVALEQREQAQDYEARAEALAAQLAA